MKITKNQLKSTLTILKQIEVKDQVVMLQIKENVLQIQAKKEGMILKLKSIKTEEEDSELIAIKKEFLTKIEKQESENFELKINKKTISSKVNGVSFSTAIMAEEMNFEIQEEDVEGTKVMITQEIMKTLENALLFVLKDTKKPILQGIYVKLEKGVLKIASTDTVKMYVNELDCGYEGEMEVVIKPDTISLLKAVFEANGEKNFPIIVNNKAVMISSKGMYFKGVVLEGTYPNIVSVLKKSEEKKVDFSGEIKEDVLKKLKAIENKTSILHIKKEGKEMMFETKSEIDTNSFKIEEGSEKDFEKKVNYYNFLSVLGIANTLEIKEDFFVFTKEKTKILLMALKD
jgi:DNA polymerase III sliding clamp (beta) subunit (PCNA family)